MFLSSQLLFIFSGFELKQIHGSSNIDKFQQIRAHQTVDLQPPPAQHTQYFNPVYETDFVPMIRNSNDEDFKPFVPNYKSTYYDQKNIETSELANSHIHSTPPPKQRFSASHVVYNQARVPSKKMVTKMNRQPPTKTVVNFTLIHDHDPKLTQAHVKGYFPRGEKIYYTNGLITNLQATTATLLPYQQNVYDNINPFAAPDFDFDKFLERFRQNHHSQPVSLTTKRPYHYQKTWTTTGKPKTTTPNDYYYDDDDYEIDINKSKHPQVKTSKFVSTTIRPRKLTTSKYDDEYYYVDEEDYDEITTVSPKQSTNKTVPTINGDVKYSAKYREPLHNIPYATTDRVTTTTSQTYTVRQMTKRPPKASNRQKSAKSKDEDIRQYNKTPLR